MLLLSVKEGDYIMIGDDIKVKIIGGSNVSKVGIEAPKDVAIRRQAVYERDVAATEERVAAS
ncbi:MAG: carbon storage regulator [Oscillospiraceae bacterium]|nr:carbon storage regulator [Oscillospiraceae bacterium]